ncbi:helix-turn-helix domain-containing protein, partial [Streptomyces halstedii]
MHKQALHDFLKERRARITPKSVGLPEPTGPGRRTTGLSQQNIDHLLHSSVHTYYRLETGKTPRVK